MLESPKVKGEELTQKGLLAWSLPSRHQSCSPIEGLETWIWSLLPLLFSGFKGFHKALRRAGISVPPFESSTYFLDGSCSDSSLNLRSLGSRLNGDKYLFLCSLNPRQLLFMLRLVPGFNHLEALRLDVAAIMERRSQVEEYGTIARALDMSRAMVQRIVQQEELAEA